MPAQPPVFVFGGAELFMVILATVVIFAIVGPKFVRERRRLKG